MRRTLLLGALLAAVWAALAMPASSFAADQPKVGEVRNWVGLDSLLTGSGLLSQGGLYAKPYTLRGVGPHIEIWVASGFAAVGGQAGAYNLEFPSNTRERGRSFDCRSGATTQITDAQVQYVIGQFEDNIYPKESANFSVPVSRDGTKANATIVRSGLFNTQGPGDHIVVLVDNVRDENFYSYQNEGRFSYIAGFHFGYLNDLFDRNFMTIDAYDWLHRLGANPPNDALNPLPPVGTLTRLCGSRAAAPFLYESTFAHEYQHLLERYASPGEKIWINEGLSDFAQTLTGYVDSVVAPPDQRSDGHIWCFLGFLPNSLCGGPENSLTLWNDQSNQQNEVLADYGAAYTFMLYLYDHFGTPFMSALHREKKNGIAGLQAALDSQNTGLKAQDVIHRWAATVALDKVLDDGRSLVGGDAALFTSKNLGAQINWDSSESYSTPGAPPNGSDYVRLRDAGGNFLGASQLSSISFQGVKGITRPLEWKVTNAAPADASNPALWSGTGNNLDRSIVREIAVPAGAPSLVFEAQWNTERTWDFGFAQISTDGGATYKSLACTDTSSETDPDAIDTVKSNVPGFTGDSGGWKTETCDLSAYAGKSVLLAFRYVTDSGVAGETDRITPGFYIRKVSVAGTQISNGNDLSSWKSPTQVRPVPVSGYTVQLVAWNTKDKTKAAYITTLKLDADFKGTLDAAAIKAALGDNADLVGAIVTFDEPTESLQDYAPYTLTVNGVTQPGGS